MFCKFSLFFEKRKDIWYFNIEYNKHIQKPIIKIYNFTVFEAIFVICKYDSAWKI